MEHRKVCDIPSRKSKTHGFQNRRAEFRATVNLIEEKSIEVTLLPLL
jgi:hypothetical protein